MSAKQDIANGYQQFINNWKWDLHLTLTFPTSISIHGANTQTRKFLKTLQRKHKLNLAGILIINKSPTSTHIHVVLICHKFYKTPLNQIQNKELQQHWKYFSKITRKDTWNNEQISNYLSQKHNIDLSHPDIWDLQYFRPALLQRLKQE